MAPTSGAGRRDGADIGRGRGNGVDIRRDGFGGRLGQLNVGDGPLGRVAGDGGVVTDGGQAAGVEALRWGLQGRVGPSGVLTIV